MATLFATAPRKRVASTPLREIASAVLVASAALLAFSYARPARFDAAAHSDATHGDQGWTGQLTGATTSSAAPVQPLSSSSLVVPSAALALPPVPKPMARVKNSCDTADRGCVVRPVAGLVPPKRVAAALDGQTRVVSAAFGPNLPKSAAEPRVPEAKAKGFSFNPLDHVPDTAAIVRPFTAAGATVTAWMKSL